ncbi:DUF2254 domain-containing protein [Accumulibacter sp.]|uniref:DUF2254 domain-containing protein n=1 Tax=Accumulibacter sp. TaxID=2053492 RepID=UPI0028C3B0A8|nr:DUF2254 domain-containing protein [Accumulibacter sp.]
MRAWLFKYWERLNSSFWFLPTLMAFAAVALSLVTVAVDRTATDRWLASLGWAYTGGAEGASAVLQTIAGSMITIAGVVFSLTLVALSLASSQFGPRLLRNFMRDTANQVVLGTFVATFLYCLMVLLHIRRPGDGAFVPSLSVTLGVVFALASLWVLIYYIHHVSVSIQADEIIARVSQELFDGIDHLFPEQLDAGGPDGDANPAVPALISLPDGLPPCFTRFDQDLQAVMSSSDGYLQMVDGESLLSLACAHDVVLRIEHRPGAYVLRDSPLLTVWPAQFCSEELAAAVNGVFVLGNQRTSGQDIEFAIEQLIEIAARALSPGVNDPFTAIACVDRLGSALHRLARRCMPSPCHRDPQGVLRVWAPATTFAQLVDTAFNQIRQYARRNTAVTLRLLETIAVVAPVTHCREQRAALQRQADMLIRGARDGLPEEEDRRAAEQRYLTASQRLSGGDDADARPGAAE